MKFNTKKVIKKIAGYILNRTYFMYSSAKRMNIILMYHRVLKSPPDGYYEPGLYVNSSTFEMHLKQVSKTYNLVPLATIIEDGKRKGGFCAVTFDDGWIDTYDIAFPILRKYKVPATVFVPTDFIGKENCFWFENLTILANKTAKNNVQPQFLQYFTQVIPTWKPLSLSNDSLCDLISCMKQLPSNYLSDIISRAYKEIGVEVSDNIPIVNWEQMLEMSQYDISFAPHGAKHYILPTLSSDMKRDEIVSPLCTLRERGIQSAPIFSYPNGSWDDESVKLLSESGYIGAVTTRLGYNSGSEISKPFLLNRIGLHDAISHTPSLFWFRIFQAFIAE